jgi:DNA-binding beta-propeller fold protein YncE
VTIEDNTDIRSDDEDRRSRTTRMALVAMLVVLLLLLVGLMAFVVNIVTPAGSRKAQTSAPAGLTWVRSIYGYGRTADQLLKTPVDVAIGSGGRIWVTDPDRARIFGFNPDGSYATLIHRGPAGPGAGRIQRTEGIGTDEDGNLYVCDYGNEKVLVFGPDGTFVREWSVPLPTDVAVRGGRVVVSSIPGVSVFTTTGTLMSVWGKRGRGPDEFDAAHGVALAADGTAYIADTQNQRVKAYDKDGKLLWIWPVSKTQSPMPGLIPTGSPDTVQMPTSVALDGNGRLIVVDAFGFDLVVLNVTTKAATIRRLRGAGRILQLSDRDRLRRRPGLDRRRGHVQQPGADTADTWDHQQRRAGGPEAIDERTVGVLRGTPRVACAGRPSGAMGAPCAKASAL